MIEQTEVGSITVLKLDVVRMNPKRLEAARLFTETSYDGVSCNAFLYMEGDEIDRIELWAGDAIQRQAFVQNLERELTR